MPKSKKRANRKGAKSQAPSLRSEMKRSLRDMDGFLRRLIEKATVPPPKPTSMAEVELEFVREMVLPNLLPAAALMLERECDPYLVVVNVQVEGDFPIDHEEEMAEVLHPQYTPGGRAGLTAAIDHRLRACDPKTAVGIWFVPFKHDPLTVLPLIYLRHVTGAEQIFFIRDNGELIYQPADKTTPTEMLDEIVSRIPTFEKGLDIMFEGALRAIAADPARSRAFAEEKDWRALVRKVGTDPDVVDCLAGLSHHGMKKSTSVALDLAEELDALRDETAYQLDAMDEHLRESLEGADEAARKRFAAELEKRDMLVKGATARAEKLQSDLSALRAAAPVAAAPKSVPNATPPDQLALALADLFR